MLTCQSELLYFTFVYFISAKVRRLYDIANVLSSLELIKKVHVTEERGRKPAFKWTGPDVLSSVQGRCVCVISFCSADDFD